MGRWIWPVALAAFALFPACAEQGRGRGKGHNKDSADGGASTSAAVVFRQADRDAIRQYYAAQPGGLPPGLAKRESLPPGLEKQLRRNGKLPPGLEKKLVVFPPPLEQRLPPCPADVQRGMIGGIAVMWSPKSGLVLDAAVLFH